MATTKLSPTRPRHGRPLLKTFDEGQRRDIEKTRSRYPSFAEKPVYLTPEEVAEWLRVRTSWVYEKTRRRCENALPCLRIGRYIRFDKFKVRSWLDKQMGGDV